MKKKILLGSLVLILLLVSACLLRETDQAKFDKLTSRLFVSEMTSNTLNMHYAMADPAAFGIRGYTPTLPIYTPGAADEAAAEITRHLDALKNIQREKLSDPDAYLYSLLKKQLENSLTRNRFYLFQSPLSPANGVQSQFPILLSEYCFRTKKDVEDYLALLEQSGEYLDSLLLLEKEKAALGYGMSTVSLRSSKIQCDTIVTKEELENGSHFLQTGFKDRVSALAEKDLITSAEATRYIAQNDRLLKTVLQPAYERLADGLFLLEDSEKVPASPRGMGALPGGAEYYRALLFSETGSVKSVEEIKTLLNDKLKEEYSSIGELIKLHPRLSVYLKRGEYTDLPLSDPNQILTDLQLRMKDTFPPFSGNSGGYPPVTVNYVLPSMEDYCAPAFYLSAPIDDTDTNVIYINRKETLHPLELYTTLAHEGYPGHLYQTVYYNQNALSGDFNPAREILWYGGYQEGWALYVEFTAFDYAGELLRSNGRENDACCVEYEKHSRNLLLCLYSLLDIQIHYENASLPQIEKTLAAFGVTQPDTARAIYNYIADNPCNYLKYYLGYLEIEELRETAKTLWGDGYSDYRFHCFFLDAGPSDFETLDEALRADLFHGGQKESVRH